MGSLHIVLGCLICAEGTSDGAARKREKPTKRVSHHSELLSEPYRHITILSVVRIWGNSGYTGSTLHNNVPSDKKWNEKIGISLDSVLIILYCVNFFTLRFVVEKKAGYQILFAIDKWRHSLRKKSPLVVPFVLYLRKVISKCNFYLRWCMPHGYTLRKTLSTHRLRT